MEEVVVENRDRASGLGEILRRRSDADNSPDTEHLRVVLAGYLDWHFEDQLQHLIFRWAILDPEEQTRLADVLNRPRTELGATLQSKLH